MGSKGGEEGLVSSEGGEGVDAYCMEYRTTTMLLSSSLSLISLSCAYHVADCNMVLLAHWVVCGSGAMGAPDIVVHGCWLSFYSH